MFDVPKRQHPVAIITNTIAVIRNFLIPIVISIVVGTGNVQSESQWEYLLRILPIALVFITTLSGGFIQWFRFYYWLEGDEFRVKKGLFVRKQQFIPRHRIQVIDISSGIIQRMFGLVSLNVQTAGGDTPGVTISAIQLQEALAIRAKLRKEEQSVDEVVALDGGFASDVTEDSISNPFQKTQSEFKLTGDHLLIGAATSGGFGVFLSVLATIYSQISSSIDEDRILGWFSNLPIGDTNTFVIAAILLVIIAWIMSVSSFILKFANFRIRKLDRELVISKGLLERKQVTIPFQRIQAIRVVEGVLRQPFGYATIMVDSAGFGEKSGTTTELIPLIPKKDVAAFLQTFLLDYDVSATAVHPPERAIFRFIIRSTRLPLIAGIALGYFTGLWYLLPALLPFGIALGLLRFKETAAGVSAGNYFVGRFRNLARTTVIVPGYRIQSSKTTQNPFQVYNTIADLRINIASSNTGAEFAITNLDQEDADELLQWCRIERPKPILGNDLLVNLPAFRVAN